MRNAIHHARRWGWLALALVAGCAIGPDFLRPKAPAREAWTDAANDRLNAGAAVPEAWWTAFGDPGLEKLVAAARKGNPGLESAGMRVLQARATRAIVLGNVFPQTQEVTGSVERERTSENVGQRISSTKTTYSVGLDASWEIDLWGRFRRAIESADASVDASVADFQDVMVSLLGDVASRYVQLRVLDERIALAHANIDVQREGLELARVRFEAGGTSDLDVQQATALLADTEATIASLEISRRQVENALAILVGVPPGEIGDVLASAKGIPAAPESVAVGIPADVIRRRPDVRLAEDRLAAQSAQIGVAKADLLPRIRLVGSIGLSSERARQLFEGNSLEALGGPSLEWPVLNYGRIVNAVRVEDARFEELASDYVAAVLDAERDVEDALAAYVWGGEQVARLDRAAAGARRAVELSLIQYREGAADYTRVLTAQQAKLAEEDRLVTARGALTLSVVSLYRALGGGWETATAEDLLDDTTRERMRERTDWGGMLDQEKP